MFFNKNTLGLESQPLYFTTLAAKLSAYEAVLVKYHENAKNTERGAAARWLNSKTKVHYKSFLEEGTVQYDLQLNTEDPKIADKALHGQRAAYKAGASAGVVHPLPIDGHKAAKKALKSEVTDGSPLTSKATCLSASLAQPERLKFGRQRQL